MISDALSKIRVFKKESDAVMLEIS